MKYRFKSKRDFVEFKDRFEINEKISKFVGDHRTVFSGEPDNDGNLRLITLNNQSFCRTHNEVVFTNYEVDCYLDVVSEFETTQLSLKVRNAETAEIKALETQIRALEAKLENAKQRLHKARHDL